MQTKTTFAIIGAGAVAQAYAKAFALTPWAQVVAVVDTRLEAARKLGADLGARAFHSHAALLAQQRFDAALLCTTPATHCPIALDLTYAGKHVLCEKPLSADVPSAKCMLESARSHGVILTMSSKFRYVDDVVQTKRFVQGGLIGEVLLIENSFSSRLDMSKSWHADPSLSGGGVIIDKATDAVDIVRFLGGPITAVSACEAPRAQHLVVEDTAHLVARTCRNVLANIDVSWSLNKQNDSYIRVCGSEGTIALDWSGSKYCSAHGGTWVRFGKGYDQIAAFAAQLDNFCRAIQGKEALSITPDDALASVEAVAAAYRSLRSRRWTTVLSDESGQPEREPSLVAAGA